MNSFYRWVNSIHGFAKDPEKPETAAISHTLLNGFNGGQLCIAEKHAGDFLREYANYAKSTMFAEGLPDNAYLYISEYRTPIFRFMFDLDLCQIQPITEAEEMFIYRTIQDIIRKFYPELPEESLTMLITARPSSLDARRPNWHKQGRHGILPFLHVNQEIASTLRESIVIALEEKERPEKMANSWSDVVDQRIYGPNGLRMAYSYKMKACSECTGAECFNCEGRKRIRDPQCYTPHMFIRANGENDPKMVGIYQLDIFKTVLYSSIRLTSDQELTPGFQLLPNCPVPRIGGAVVEIETKDGRRQFEFAEDFKARQKFRNHVRIPAGSPEWAAIELFIRNHMPDVYQKVKIKDIFTPPQLAYYHVLLKGFGSNYCMNIGASHRSNTAYFLFKPKGVTQKCHCTCDTLMGRKYGLCKKFESQVFPMIGETKDALFPNPQSRAGRTLFGRKTDRQLQSDARYMAVQNIVCRLSALLQESRPEIAAKQVEERRQRVENYGKRVKSPAGPATKRRKQK